MVSIKSKQEIETLKSGGAILASILRELEVFTRENYKNEDFTTLLIDKKCDELLKKNGVISSFKNYSYHESSPYPSNVCVSINDEVVHGIPSVEKIHEGDLISLDLGVLYEGLYTDAAISFIIGSAKTPQDTKLVETAKNSLMKGIEKARVGNTIGDIGNAIETYIKGVGFQVVRDYCGHGVGYSVHEEPSIPNYGVSGQGIRLEKGMILAIEPMVVAGSPEVYVDKTGWTVKTRDSGLASHWEHTVVVTASGPVILTE